MAQPNNSPENTWSLRTVAPYATDKTPSILLAMNKSMGQDEVNEVLESIIMDGDKNKKAADGNNFTPPDNG